MINYYELLGVNQGASEDDIRAKLKMKKRVWTQRQNAPKPEQQQEASNNLRLIPEIEATLLDAEKRSAYDKRLRTTPKEESHLDMSSIEAEDLIAEGWHLLGKGNVPDALMVATKATEIQGKNPDAWALLGYCKSQWGEFEDAVYEYKRAIKLKPNDASYYFDLGSIYENMEQWDNALQQYQKAEQIDPSVTIYRAATGGLLIKNGMYDEGIKILEKCLEEEPENDDYKWFLAIGYIDGAQEDWTFVKEGEVDNIAEGYYPTSKEQMQRTEERIRKAESLGINDQEYRELMSTVKEDVENLKKRKPTGFIRAAVIWGIIGAITLFAGGIGAGILIMAMGGLYYFSSLSPVYKINNNLINQTKTGKAGNFILGMFPEHIRGFIIIFLLPIMIPWNFYNNYIVD